MIEDPHFSASIQEPLQMSLDISRDPGFPSLTTSDLTSNHPEATWKFVKIHQALAGRQVPPLEVEVAGFPNPICWLFKWMFLQLGSETGFLVLFRFQVTQTLGW